MSEKIVKSGMKQEKVVLIQSVFTALTLSISLGFVDLIINILHNPLGPFSISVMLRALAVTTCFFFFLYLALWYTITHLSVGRKLQNYPLDLALAFFIGTVFTLGSMMDLLHLSFSIKNLFNLIILILFSISFAIGIYFTAQAIQPNERLKNTLTAFAMSVPFLLSEALLIIWLNQTKAFSGVALPIVSLLMFSLTIGIFCRLLSISMIKRALAAFMILVVVSPVTTFIPLTNCRASLPEVNHSLHPVKLVILLTVDTLRPDALSCYNPEGQSTPHIDRLANDGVLFRRAISAAPWTLSALSSIMTGVSPTVHGVITFKSELPDTLQTLAEILRGAGYQTAAIGRNIFCKPYTNLSQGFNEYDFFPKAKPVSFSSFGARFLQRIFSDQFQSDVSTNDITRLARDWLESNQTKDFFLWIHYFDPHLPYSPPRNFLPAGEPPEHIGVSFSEVSAIRSGYMFPSFDDRDWIKSLYDGEVRYIDENIGKLIQTLKQLNLYEESLIVFSSDHGEEFWEHDSFAHGHTLYNELLAVPLIIKLPYSSQKKEITRLAPTQSIMATILDLCKINYESDDLMSGSLTSFWTANSKDFESQPIISTGLVSGERRESVIFDGLKYIRSFVTNHEELYDLTSDPMERKSLVSSLPTQAQRAKMILKDHHDMAKGFRERHQLNNKQKITLDKETAKQLKSLGYIN